MIYTVDTSKTIDWNAKGNNLTVQNIANIKRTFKYEVGYFRTMGISRELLDLPLNQIKGRLAVEIIDQIKEHYPDITIKSVEVLNIDESGNLKARAVIDI
jgi:hypothetical protein